MRKPVIAGNWKMYKTVGESVDTALALKPLVANANHCEVVIAPVFTALKTVADRLEGSNIRVAGQNCSTEIEEGAHTGEVAAIDAARRRRSHVIVGHSERRQFYFETDSMVNKKCQAAIAAGLDGHSVRRRKPGAARAGKCRKRCERPVNGGLSGLTASDLDRIIVAYEPVWAIGTGRTATPEQAQEMHAFIRRVFAERHSADGGRRDADSLRRLGQARQHCGLDVAGGHRWRIGRRREFEGREFCADC